MYTKYQRNPRHAGLSADHGFELLQAVELCPRCSKSDQSIERESYDRTFNVGDCEITARVNYYYYFINTIVYELFTIIKHFFKI